MPASDSLHNASVAAAELISASPQLQGVTITAEQRGGTFTVLASHGSLRLVDAAHYLMGGPSPDRPHGAAEIHFETLWCDDCLPVVGVAGAIAGTRAMSCLAVETCDASAVTLNLYAREIAVPSAAVTDRQVNALRALAGHAGPFDPRSFRGVSTRPPDHFGDLARLRLACRVLARSGDCSQETAAARLRSAALRAGVPPRRLADVVITAADLLAARSAPGDEPPSRGNPG